jgi:hypothetical protein
MIAEFLNPKAPPIVAIIAVLSLGSSYVAFRVARWSGISRTAQIAVCWAVLAFMLWATTTAAWNLVPHLVRPP